MNHLLPVVGCLMLATSCGMGVGIDDAASAAESSALTIANRDVATSMAMPISPAQPATPAPAAAHAFRLRTSSSNDNPVRFEHRFNIDRTYDVWFAVDAPAMSEGSHQLAIDVFGPGDFAYAHLTATFEGDRAWVSMPVAGTWIETSSLSGQWSAKAFVDGAGVANATVSFGLQ